MIKAVLMWICFLSSIHTISGSPCPGGWVHRGATCYLANSSSTMSWAGADALCRERGANLTRPLRRGQLLDVTDVVRGRSVKEWWVGARRTGAGAAADDFAAYAGDDKAAPQEDVPSAQCAYVSTSDTQLYWARCDTALHYICHRPAERVHVQLVSPERRRPDRHWFTAHGAAAEVRRRADQLASMQQDDKGTFSPAKATMTPLPARTTTVSVTAATSPLTRPPAPPTAGVATEPTTVTRASSVGRCQGDNWLYLSGACYQLVLDASNASLAADSCYRRGGALANLSAPSQRRLFLSQFGHNTGSVWIGPTRTGTCRALALHTGEQLFPGCGAYKPYVCERTETATAMPTTERPPTTPSPCGSADAGWWHYGDSCYLLVRTPPALSWHGARRACAARGAHLTVLSSSAETHNVFHRATQSNLPVWIGLSKLQPPHTQFLWEDGEPLGSAVSVFMDSMDQSAFSTDMASCVRLDNEQPHWRAVNCNSPQYYVCERPLDGSAPRPPVTGQPAAAVGGVCAAGWRAYGQNSCLQVADRLATWADARRHCIANGADLVTIHNPVEQAFVTAALRETRTGLWIGLTYVQLEQHFLTWVDEAPVNFTNWAPGQPSQHDWCDGCPRTCGMIGGGHSHAPGAWSDVDCSQTFQFICQRAKVAPPAAGNSTQVSPPPRTQCPPPHQDFTAVEDACLKVVRAPAGWAEAGAVCGRSNSSLAYVGSALDNADLVTFLQAEDAERYWIALSDRQQYGRMQWSSPWPSEPTFSAWEAAHRSAASASCAALTPSTGGHWRHLDCAAPLPFVCMYAPRRQMADSAATVTGQRCPSSQWSAGDGRCYRLQDSERHTRTWREAKQACESQGQQLAVISTRSDFLAVQDALNGLSFSNSAWIGLKQNDEGEFVWVDGGRLEYDAGWQRGEPSAALETCVEASRADAGRWNDVRCAMYRPYVCMVEMKSDDTPQPARSAARQAAVADAGMSGWAVLALVLVALVAVAAALLAAVWLKRRLSLRSPGHRRLSSGRHSSAHHSVENIAYASTTTDLPARMAERSADNFEAGASAMWGEEEAQAL